MEHTSARQRHRSIDEVLAFAIPDLDCRGRIVRVGPVLGEILSAHAYAPPIKELLAEALVLTSLMGSLLKGAGDQLTIQAQTRGGLVGLLVCDFRDGELRGYVQHDSERGASLGSVPSLATLFGDGYLAITFEVVGTGQRYQGVVPLEGETLTEAVQAYFERSEQVPTLIRTAVRLDGARCSAGGLLVQHLAEGEEGRERLDVRQILPEWGHVSALAGSIQQVEMVDVEISLDRLIWRLYHEECEVRVGRTEAITRGCRCSERHFEEVLARFPSEDRREMRDERGFIVVDCAFCSRVFTIED